jgi:hypothetical protein
MFLCSVGSLGLSFLPQSVVESQADILARLGPIMLALGIIVGVSEVRSKARDLHLSSVC